MFKSAFFEVFSSKWNFVVFTVHTALFVSQGLLVTYSQESSNSYKYNTVVAVLCTEILKLIMSIIGYYSGNPTISILQQCINHHKVLWLYFAPSFLYCLSNNLSYINLLHFDPATYVILIQSRVLVIGILFQIIFSKILTCLQWFSLVMLTIGCMIKNIDFENLFYGGDSSSTNETQANVNNSTSAKMNGIGFDCNTGLIFTQILSSCFAGVYCEYLIKIRGLKVDIFIQNFFMYLDSVICNILVLFVQHDTSLFSATSFHQITQFIVLLIIFNSALAGIITSFFLKYLNSIVKNISSALELVFITILSSIFFNFPIKFGTILSITLIIISIALYSQNPVQNPPKTEEKEEEIKKI